MSKFSNNLNILFNNPIVFTPLFTNFYQSLNETPKNILLSYFVLPLALNDQTKRWLVNSNKRSSLYTFSKISIDKNSPAKTKHDNLFGLQERLQFYKEMTNLCLQYAFDNKWLKLNEDLSISTLHNEKNKIDLLKDSYKASGKINNIFDSTDILRIYTMLGVKKL